MAGDEPKSSALEDKEDEDPFYADLLNVMDSPNPNLMDMTFPDVPPPVLTTPSKEINETQFLNDINLSITNRSTNDEFDGLSFLDDDFTISWDMFEPINDDLNETVNNNVPGEINDNGNNNVGETTRLEVSTRVFGDNNGANFETGGTSTTPVPVSLTIPDGIALCTCCILLRELIHTDGYAMNSLEIHGGIGFICHATLMTRPFANSSEGRCQTIDLKDLTIEDVKSLIEQHCFTSVASGLLLVQDTISEFFQAMIANSVQNQSLTSTIPSRDNLPMSLVTPDQTLDVPPVPPNVGLRDTGLPKERPRRQTRLAAQRKRTGKMTVKDICMHFHIPIEAAARKLDLCPTVLKKICRKGGLDRWPHRKIKSLQGKIEKLKRVLLTAKNDGARERAEAEIERLQRQIDMICNEAAKNNK